VIHSVSALVSERWILVSCLVQLTASTHITTYKVRRGQWKLGRALPAPWRIPSPPPSPRRTVFKPPSPNPFLPHPLLDLRHRPADLSFPLPTRPNLATQAASSAVSLSRRRPSLLPAPRLPHACSRTLPRTGVTPWKARPRPRQPQRPFSPRDPTRDRQHRRPRSLMTGQSLARGRQ
jgi:hypothetical protein